jgi:hypothetical protein
MKQLKLVILGFARGYWNDVSQKILEDVNIGK